MPYCLPYVSVLRSPAGKNVFLKKWFRIKKCGSLMISENNAAAAGRTIHSSTLNKVSYRFKSCEYIFLRTSSAQDLNSFSLFTKHGHGKRGVLENENKRATRKHSNFGGKTSMHKSTSILDFFKRNSRPPSGGSFTAYGILLCYANLMLY